MFAGYTGQLGEFSDRDAGRQHARGPRVSPHRAIAVVLGLVCTVCLAVAAETNGSFGVTMITGLETNPLRVSGDGPDGFFTQLQLDGGVNRSLSPSVALYLDGRVRGRLHESGVTDADNANGDVRFGASLTPSHFARGRFGLSTGGLYSAYRGTFTDRDTGGVYEVDAIPGGPSRPSRFPIA